MSSGHTRSLFVWCGGGIYQPQYPYLHSVGAMLKQRGGRLDLEASQLVVSGGLKRGSKWLYLNNHWSAVSAAQGLELFETALADDSVHEVRAISKAAGNNKGPGSEPALLLGLDGSAPARKLAQKWGVDYRVKVVVGPRGQEVLVEHGPSVMMSVDCARRLTGQLVFPKLERQRAFASKMDDQLPSYWELLEQWDQSGSFPERQAFEGDQEMRGQIEGLPKKQPSM